MEASAGLVAGSHNRNELVVIRRDGESGPKPLKQLTGQKCQICGDDVGVTVDGELFVACNECAFPVCRTCYEYERQEGSQICPQCKTRFKRLKGCARVEGDEEEDDIDDVENEFNFEGRVRDSAKLLDSRQHSLARSEAMLHGHGGWHMSYGHIFDSSELHPHVFHNTNNSNTLPQLPLLTNGHMVDDDIPPEQHALVPSTVGVGGGSSSTRIHPLPFSDPSLPVQSRSMDPSKDLAAYGYGSVAWKERMESWKHKQEKQHLMKHENHGNNDWDDDGDGMDLPLRITTLEIFSNTRLERTSGIRGEEVKFWVNQLMKNCGDGGYSKVNLKNKFLGLSFDVITMMIMGKRFYGEGVEDVEEAKLFQNLMREHFELANTSNPADIFPVLRWVDFFGMEKKFVANAENMDKFLQDLVDKRRRISASTKTKTLIENLLSFAGNRTRVLHQQYYKRDYNDIANCWN